MFSVLSLLEGMDVEELMEQRDEKELMEYMKKQGKTVDYAQLQALKDCFSDCVDVDDSKLDETQLELVSGGSYKDAQTGQQVVSIVSGVGGIVPLLVAGTGPIGVGVAMGLSSLVGLAGNFATSYEMGATVDDYQKFSQYSTSQTTS